MKNIYLKLIIILFIFLIKILIWYTFQNQVINLANYICENLRLTPIGKQDLFSGISKGVKVFKVSCFIVDFLLNLVIVFFVKFIIKKFILNRFICNYLIINSVILILILFIF
mgnify:CR=1 FL=1